MTIRKKIRLGLIIVLLIFLGFITWKKVVPLGEFSYEYDFSQESRFVSELTPKTRTKGDNTIISEPVYLSLFTPRQFQEAELTLNYKNHTDSDIKTGFLVDEQIWRYNMKPVENKNLEELAQSWNSTKEDDLLLLQKNKDFSGIDNFLNSNLKRDEVALYNYDLNKDFRLPDYEPNSELSKKNLFLRGSHEFFLYSDKQEELKVNFKFRDLNQNKDRDDIELNLYYKDNLILNQTIEDDRGRENSGQTVTDITKEIELRDNLSGVYKLEIKTTDDIVLEELSSYQDKIVVNNKLWLYKQNRNNFSIYSDAPYLKVKTMHPSSLQTIEIKDDNKLTLDETYKQHHLDLRNLNNFKSIDISTDGVILETQGVFSLDENSWFNPKFKEFNSDLELDNIEYVLANYTPPEHISDQARSKTLNFSLDSAYREDGKYKLLISIPDIQDTDSSYVEITNIEVDFTGRNLWHIIQDTIL